MPAALHDEGRREQAHDDRAGRHPVRARRLQQLALSVEHRAAPAITAVSLQLAVNGDAVALTATPRAAASPASVIMMPITLADKILALLADATTPLTAAALRTHCHIRNTKMITALTALVAAGRVRKDPAGYVLSR